MNKSFFKKFLPEITGAVLGALGGFIYWKYVGCASGTCTIKSNWYLMIPWGMIMGFLIGSVAGDLIRKRKSAAAKKDN
jgi:F0F1-type ATP synthase assembly protein I